MKRNTTLLAALFSLLCFIPSLLFGATINGPDTCSVNDDACQAIVISGVESDEGFVCITGCNEFASPEFLDFGCGTGSFPSVWYKVTTDGEATVLNIEVNSSAFESPTIVLFQELSNCNDLVQTSLTGSQLPCIMGADGSAKAIGTKVGASTTYYILVSSHNSIGGNFELCVNTQSKAFNCVIDRDLELTARSNGGPLEGPFDPAETISFCLNINEYSAANNGCQWFQGVIPVFGNGWDPSSFDANGQPLNATINGDSIGKAGNGRYGSATWDWFTNVDYHHDHDNLKVVDLDNNGTVDMCNSAYEIDCPSGGLSGACCNPCWVDSAGTVMAPGWFSYGINGSCNIPGPPVGVDWGDGNSCGDGMGPWQFCFDLKTRDVPDCMVDSTRTELTIGFFTFADGEVGAWTGSASVCALDHPIKVSLQAKCGRVTTSNIEQLPPQCTGEVLQYHIEAPDVTHWEWNISPYWAVPYPVNQGENGFNIEAPLINNTDQPIDVNGTLIGYVNGSNDKIIRQFTFKLNDAETCGITSTEGNSIDQYIIRAYPNPADEHVILEWFFDLQQNATIGVYNAHGVLVENLPVSIADGRQKQIDTGSWSSGIYFISLGNADFRKVIRMVRL